MYSNHIFPITDLPRGLGLKFFSLVCKQLDTPTQHGSGNNLFSTESFGKCFKEISHFMKPTTKT